MRESYQAMKGGPAAAKAHANAQLHATATVLRAATGNAKAADQIRGLLLRLGTA